MLIITPTQNHLLYSPKLLDLEHGTIRHRDKELVEENKEEEVRQGYFYHAQLTDWADGMCHTNCVIFNNG